MNIVILGGAGFIGAHLTRAYLDAGHRVVVIDNLSSGSSRPIDTRARFYQVDVRDRRLVSILQQERPDIVCYYVGRPQSCVPEELALADADVHVRGVLNVLAGCVSASVGKFIFASQGNTLYGRVDAACLPITEDCTLAPSSPTDISAVTGEYYVRYYTSRYALKHTILRYADVYGETLDGPLRHPVSYCISMLAQRRRPILRSPYEEVRDSLFIEDVVQASCCALQRGENQTLHISAGQGYTLKQMYERVAALMGSEIEPLSLASSLQEVSVTVLSNAKAQRVLGWSPRVTLSEGISRAIELLGGWQKVSPPDNKQVPLSTTARREVSLSTV